MRRWCVVLGCVAVVIVSEVVLASAAAVVDEQPVTAGRQTPLAWPPCLAQGRKRRTAGSVDGSFQYAVVVDAGSTGSRVRVYGWPTPTGEARVALQASGVVEINSTKIRPGLSSHVGDLQRVTYDIHRVLSFAAKYVPGPLQHSSPVYVMATAGMRQVVEERMNLVMDHIDSLLRNSSFQPFRYTSSHSARILSGEEEGVFAWIAVNYLRGVFTSDRHVRRELAGVLEMGGASTQIAFVPEGDILAAKFPVLLGGRRYPLYVHSYLVYGQNSIDDEIKKLLVAESSTPSSQPIVHPCMLRGDTVWEDDLNRNFTGSGNPSGCRHLLNQLVQKVEPSRCNPKPCGIGGFYQPRINGNTTFYAVGAFRHALRAIDAVTSGGIFVPRTGFEKAAEFCVKDINEVLTATVEEPKHVRERCQIVLYVATLFTRGYGFANDTQQIRVLVSNEINGQQTEWTLGAMLYEDELAAISACGIAPQTAQVVGSSAASVVSALHWTVTSMSILYTFQHIQRQ